MSARELSGSCHCGAVRFRVIARHSEVLECNCSICRKKGLLHLIVPTDDFVLERGSEALTTYCFNTGVAKHTFCRICGVQAFYTPRSHPDQVDVNPRCLDDGAGETFTVTPFDGENWEQSVDSIR